MLIDRSYFVGEINIPNWDQPAIGELLDAFIEKYEDQFLREALGLDLYNALKAGLLVAPVDQRFTDLIDGKAYTWGNYPYEWRGLVQQAPTVLNALDALNTLSFVVNGAGPLDPTSGTNIAWLPTALIGKSFIIEQRGFGQLLSSEYTVQADVASPTGWSITFNTGNFSPGDVYFLKSASLSINTTTGSMKQSPIANYVYYWFMRDNFTQSTTMGEVNTSKENATSDNPGSKMARAWNEMSAQMATLQHYMWANTTTYPEWSTQRVSYFRRKFQTINEFNI